MIIQLSILIISLAVSINSEHQCGISGINSTFTNELNYKEKVAEDGQWPWVVGLYLKNENQSEYFCSGTLISNQYVLTAAHCIHNKGTSSLSPNQISITLGTNNNNSIIIDAIEVKIHPEWNTNNNTKFDADLVIIKLNQTIEYSKSIQPVCLPTSDEKVFEVNGFVAGFGTCSNENGVDGKLRYSKIPTVTQEKCLWQPGGYAEIASNRTFCGGKNDDGKGLIVESKSGAFKIIGIVSVAVLNSTENCSSNSYAVFTNVRSFVEWILTETGRKDEIGHQVWNHYNSSTNIIPPNSIYVNEGNMKSYVARRKIGDDLIVGKFLQEWKSIFVPYYKGELNFHDEIEILASSKNHQWIPFNGTFPYNAIQGGYEGVVKLFVGRKLIDDKYVIGKIIDNRIYVPYFSKELSFDADFEILILSDEGWHSYTLTDAIPENSISVDEGDEKTYIARRMHANNLIVGKFVPALKSIFLPFMGEELKFDNRIEVLVTSKQHQWIPFNDTFPTNTVLGGYEGQMKLYVGRKMHDGKNIIGKVIDTTKTIYIGYFSKEYAYTDSFEILVLN